MFPVRSHLAAGAGCLSPGEEEAFSAPLCIHLIKGYRSPGKAPPSPTSHGPQCPLWVVLYHWRFPRLLNLFFKIHSESTGKKILKIILLSMQQKISPPEHEEPETFFLLAKVPRCLKGAHEPWGRGFAAWIPSCGTRSDMLPILLTFWFPFPNKQPTQNYILSWSAMFPSHLFCTFKIRTI